MKQSLTFFQKVCCKLRTYYERIYTRHCEFGVTNPNKVSDLIFQKLTSPEPCMIARYGSVELYCVCNYLGARRGPNSFLDFIRAKSDQWWWVDERIRTMSDNAGFFPKGRIDLIENFCEMMLMDSKEVDVLASWLAKEEIVADYISRAEKVFLPYLEPYWSDMPWSRALSGKKVLVVHPFAELIEKQYSTKRTSLFNDDNVLPKFHLETVKAVQSIGGAAEGFSDWFEALSWMENEIDQRDYDICIIGCGAYGFPLAAHVKRTGKKAIHMGGATQLLFGIKGNRWEDPNYGVKEWGLPYGYYPNLFNDYWIKPGDEFKPRNADKVENACYW